MQRWELGEVVGDSEHFRGPGFGSQHLRHSSQSGHLTLFSALDGQYIHVVYLHTFRQNIHIHKNKSKNM